MPLNGANKELEGSCWGRVRRGEERQEREAGYEISISSHDSLVLLFLFALSVKEQTRERWAAYLWSRMSRHQTGELQGLSLSDGVDSLCVPLLLNITGMPWVYNADSRRCCGGESTECVSIPVIAAGMSSLAQQIVYWLRGCLTGKKSLLQSVVATFVLHTTNQTYLYKKKMKKELTYFTFYSFVWASQR